jgi:subtilase family serine protease
MAHNYIIVIDGELASVDGTSASSPVFAGMLSLVNSQRVEVGKSTLGWVNPLLYKYYASFTNDITGGDKNACSGLEYSSVSGYYHNCCDEGFHPTTGWDPITGLGSINVEKFSAIFGTLTFTPTAAPAASPSKSLTTGAIVGIAVAAFAVLVFLIVVIVLLLRQHRSSGPSVSTGTVVPVSTIKTVD